MRLALLSASLLLAGCSGAPAAVDGGVPAAPALDPLEALEPRAKEWDGEITGAGAILPNGDTEFVGRFTMPESFHVEEDRTALTIEMTWEALLPTAFYLIVMDKEGRHLVEASAPYDGAEGVTFHADAPLSGPWDAIGMVNGTVVDAKYHIRVTIQ
jgi:hypothetical protein